MLRHITPASILLAAGLATCRAAPEALPERRAEVASRGSEVMPFDLDSTRHVFESLPDGGLQTVLAKVPGDTLQIRLIREHLQAEARRFSEGDFSDPRAIHGHAMPGTAELTRSASQIRIEYAPTPDGGRIRYTSTDSGLVGAIHRWFEAQRMDHGS